MFLSPVVFYFAPTFPRRAEDKRSINGAGSWVYENRKVPDLSDYFGFERAGGPA